MRLGLSDITSDTRASVYTPTPPHPPPVQQHKPCGSSGSLSKLKHFTLSHYVLSLNETHPPPSPTHTTPSSSHLTLCKQCACLPCEWCHCRTAVGERLECYSLLTEAKDCGMKRPRKMFVHVYACGAGWRLHCSTAMWKLFSGQTSCELGGGGVNILSKRPKLNKPGAPRKARIDEYMTDIVFELRAR